MCIWRCMPMRTNIILEDKLVNEAFEYTAARTKKELINLALKEFVQNHSKLDLSEIKGKIKFHKKYDYKQLRKGF